MRHLFTSTALVVSLGVAAATAQESQTQPATDGAAATQSAPAVTQPAITPPDGYVEGEVALTTENLLGATVHDAAGDDIGEVHGLVFADGTTSFQGAAPVATGEAPAGATPEPAPAEGAAAPEMTTPDTTAEAPAGTATTSTPAATPAPAPETESSNAASGTDTGDNDRIENVGSDSTTTTPTDATTPPAQTATDGMAAAAPGGAEISHAVIDVGGFLGMGEHRVAIPVGDLKVYRRDTDLRIYLPWTRQQLEALPEFDENGPVPVAQ